MVATSRDKKYCKSCKCVLMSCPSPKYKSDLCVRHLRLVGNLRAPLTLIRDHQRALVDMIPCDLTSFVMAYPDIRRDLALVVLVAYVKEPFCVNVLLEQFRSHQHANTGRYGAGDLRRWLTRMMVQASGAPHLEELYVRTSYPTLFGST